MDGIWMVFHNVQEALRLDDQPDGSAEAGGLDFGGAAGSRADGGGRR
jgi:hypothetical protein